MEPPELSPLYQHLLQLLLTATPTPTPTTTPPPTSQPHLTMAFVHQQGPVGRRVAPSTHVTQLYPQNYWTLTQASQGPTAFQGSVSGYTSPTSPPYYPPELGRAGGDPSAFPFPYQSGTSLPRSLEAERQAHGRPPHHELSEDEGRRSSGETRRKAPKKVDGKQPTFLTKLYQILNTPEYHSIIRWDEQGDTIIIENPEVLAAKILPLVYRQSRFASFSRQLNIYGFMRKVSLRHVDKDINDPDASTWAHPFLKRSSTAEQVLGFKRRVPPRPPQAGKRQSSSVQDQNDPYRDDAPMHGLSPSPSDPGNTYQSPPEMYQPHQLGSLGEDEPASFPFNPSLVQSYPPPTGLQSVYAPPARPAFYMTSSSGGSSDCLGGSLPSRPVYFTSHPADPSMPSTLVEGGVPIPPDASTSTVFMSSNVRTAPQSGINSYPQTAPPYATTFPDIAKVTQGHLRTRSVQGEPPSATIMSPSSQPTLGANFGYVDFDDVALRLGGDVPTYDPQDAATWVRRGYNDIHTGEPVPSLGFREVNPNMVPYQFAPTLLSPDSTTADAFSPQSQIAETYTFPPAVEANKSHTATPRAMPIRMGRNDTRRASGSPYSPRSRPSPEVSLRDMVSFGRGTGMSRGRHSATGRSTEIRRSQDDRMEGVEELPSADIRFAQEGLFDGVLQGDQGM